MGGDPDVGSQAGAPVTLSRQGGPQHVVPVLRKPAVHVTPTPASVHGSVDEYERGHRDSSRVWRTPVPAVRRARPKSPGHRPFPPGDPGAVRMPRHRSIPRRTAQCRIRFCRVMGVAVAVVENEAAETLRAPRAPGPADGGPPARGDGGLSRRMRWIFAIAALLVVALVVSLVVRPIGAYFTPVDGWGVDALELTDGCSVHRPLLRRVVAVEQPGGTAVPARHRTGLPRLGTRRRRHHHRVVGRRHSLRCPRPPTRSTCASSLCAS